MSKLFNLHDELNEMIRGVIIMSMMFKDLQAFLSAMNALSAIYDDNLNLIWYNDDIFKEFRAERLQNHLPHRKEAVFNIYIGERQCSLNVIPIFKSKKIVGGYAMIIRTDEQVTALISSSSLEYAFDSFMIKHIKKLDRISSLSKRIIRLSNKMETPKELIRTVTLQLNILSNTKAEVKALKEIISPNSSEDFVNVVELTRTFIRNMNEVLKPTGRKIDAKIECESCFVKMQLETYLYILSEITLIHLYSSSLKTNIKLKIYSDESIFFMNMESEDSEKQKRHSDKIDIDDKKENIRELLFREDGGTFDLTKSEGRTLSVMKLNSIITQASKGEMGDLISENIINYRFLNEFFDSVIGDEIQRVEKREPRSELD